MTKKYIKSIMSEGSYFGRKWTLCSLVDEYSNMLRQSKIVLCSSVRVFNIISLLTIYKEKA
jgi:hypothetical protein